MKHINEALKRLDPAREVRQWPAAPVAWASDVDEPPVKLWKRRAFLGAVATSGAAALTGVVIVQVAEPTAPVYAATPPPLAMQYSEAAPPAGDALIRLAATLGSAPTEAPTDGRFTFVQVGQWSLDMTSSQGRTDIAVVPQVISTWRASDGSGKVVTASLGRSSLGSGPTAEGVIAAAASAEPTVETYGPQQLAAVIAEPVPSDPDGLERAFDAHQPRVNGPESVLRAVADLYRGTEVKKETRIAALRVLARTEGVLLRGTVIDRLGRPGLAVSVDSDKDGTRDLLVIDERTGRLLAHESLFLRRPELLPVKVPAVFNYVLYLDQGRRD